MYDFVVQLFVLLILWEILKLLIEKRKGEHMFLFLDYLTDTQRKRHIVGGVLMSVSLFFGGLAFTMMTVKEGHGVCKETCFG